MNFHVIDEDTIDSEALQAQIDLSMSFAQNLVTSWMEPSTFSTSSRTKNLEQELTEYMKRPPRLGVGASIPEGVQTLNRETARLKGKLAGSKTPGEEQRNFSKPEPDDEGESRARAITKRVRQDPFDVVHGKKKQKNNGLEDTLLESIVPGPPVEHSSRDGLDEIEDILNRPDQPHGSSLTLRTKREGTARVDNEPLLETVIATSPPSSTPPCLLSQEMPLTSARTSKADTLKETISVSLKKTSVLSKNLLPERPKVPLLNLTGPPGEHESDDDAITGTPTTSPKKKRKRRKKKKNHTIPGSTEANHQSISMQ